MQKKKIVLLGMLLLLWSCNGESKVVWHEKTPYGIQYIYGEGDKIGCWSVGNGAFYVSPDGEVSKSEVFGKEDERKKIANIRALPGVGIYGYLYKESNIVKKSGVNMDNEPYEYLYRESIDVRIVEIKENFGYKELVKIPDEYYNPKNISHQVQESFLVSADHNSYIIFGAATGRDVIVPDMWRDLKGNMLQKMKSNEFGGLYGDIYFLNDEYYVLSISYFDIADNKGVVRKQINLKKEYGIEEGYSSDYFVIGDDGAFYVLFNNYNIPHYMVFKFTQEMKLVGKMTVKVAGAYLEKRHQNLVSGICVDKEGSIYVTSDKELTITKYHDIKEGEDSFVDLSKMPLIR